MVVKKNLRRSKSDKKKQVGNKKTQQTNKKLPVTAESDKTVETSTDMKTIRLKNTIVTETLTPVIKAVEKLKATIEKQASIPNQQVNKLPEGFHTSRISALSNIRCLHIFYDGAPDTFALAIGVLDSFLATIKVKAQHLSCAAAACYFIATKIHEEEEDLPSGTGLCQLHGNRWKLSDLCRMESVILRKLGWRLPLTTYLTCINHFLEILQENYPAIRSQCSVERIIDMAEKYLRFGYSHFFKPSTVAICVFYQYLREADLLDSIMSVFVMKLQSICAITDSEMFECQLVLLKAEESVPEPIPKSQRLSNSLFFKMRCRPSYYGETGLPTISEDNTHDDI
ncbi:cyclin-G1 [Patella vulgata]|uniref:cyclin-G1 n=1 Tax=Patella vulgata TaxID=6465 RepID=UPI0021804FD5|nr:cyclin-G1 [Patella vulgata]